MNIHQLLSRFSHDQLTQLSDEFGVVTMSPSIRNLLNDILTKYRDDRFVARLLSELPDTHRGFLQTVVFFMPLKEQSAEIPEHLKQTWFGHEVDPVKLLFNKGLLFKKDEALTNTVVMPDDLQNTLRTLLLPKKSKGVCEEKPVDHSSEKRVRALEMVFHLLCFLDRRKAALTQKGTIHRKVLEMFEKRYPADQYTLEELYFAIAFCRHQHLAVEQGTSLRASSVVYDWFQHGLHDMLQAVWNFFLVDQVYSNKALQQFLLILRSHCPAEDGITIAFQWEQTIQSFVEKTNPSLPTGSELHQSLSLWLRMLEFIGVIQMDSLEEPNEFSITPVGTNLLMDRSLDEETVPQDVGMLQPNFDWLIPPTVGYDDLWKIDQIAEFVQRDVMTQFRLTQGSILHAMRKGWSQDEVVSFVLEHTQNRMPDNVLYSLKEWCGKYGEIRLRKVLLVECQTKLLADELTQIDALQEWLGNRISDCHFAVEEIELRNLSKALQELGYEPAVMKPSAVTDHA